MNKQNVVKNSILILMVLFLFMNSCIKNKKIEQSDDFTTNSNSNTIIPKIISDSTNTLETKTQTLELEYVGWGCACANWVNPNERIKYQNNGLIDHCVFLEPFDKKIWVAEMDSTFDYENEKILVTGQFYVKDDYPKGTVEMEEPILKARVFRYFKILKIKK